MNATDVVILGGARTPHGRLLGQLAGFSAVDLGAHAVRAAIERSGVDAAQIDQLVFGQVLQAGAGQNPARQTAHAAGIGWDVPSMTINKVCLSGIQAVIEASRLIRLGEASLVVAGGQESMTNAPHVLPGARSGFTYGDATMIDTAAFDGLTDAFDGDSMGLSTERHNGPLGISREEQDAIALSSHLRAADAAVNGLFDTEIAPITVSGRSGDIVLSTDEGVRPDSTAESLARLRPAFDNTGTITAGNSSPLSDGACALVLASREYAEAAGLPWLATVAGAGLVAGPDNSLHSQPANAIIAATGHAGWDVDGLDLIEINEAFAAVAIQSVRELGVGHERVNIHGGAIALGHPIGASGARLVLHAALELARRGGGRAAAALCGGGGQGDAILLER